MNRHKIGEISLDPLRWGLIPNWCNDPQGGRKPINAKCETVHTLPTFRDAYRSRRCILPVDGFYEWMAVKGAKAKQPFAIAMKDGRPFGIGGIWENWRDPASGEWVRTFAVITTVANELVGQIHDRMPLILAREDYGRWLSADAEKKIGLPVRFGCSLEDVRAEAVSADNARRAVSADHDAIASGAPYRANASL